MAEDKKYIIVGNAIRRYIEDKGNSSPFECNPKLVKKDSHYRKGELALVNHAITDFFSDYDKNIKKAGEMKDDTGKVMGYKMQCGFPWFMNYGDDSSPYFGFFYKHQKENIPCLMYGADADIHPKGYFLSILREGEFEEIKGLDFESVKKQVNEFYEKEKMSNHVYDSKLNEQWRNLECFDVLMKDRIHEIPVESAIFDISEEELRAREKSMKEFDKMHRRPSGVIPSDIFQPLKSSF